MSNNVLTLKLEGFSELNLNEIINISGGDWISGAQLLLEGVVVATAAIAIAATSPVSVPVLAAVTVAIVVGEAGICTGLAMMLGADL